MIALSSLTNNKNINIFVYLKTLRNVYLIFLICKELVALPIVNTSIQKTSIVLYPKA